MTDDTNKSLRRVFWIIAVLFALLAFNIIKMVVLDSKDYVTNSYNPRLSYDDPNVKRGSILDRNGTVLVESVLNDGEYVRKYNYDKSACHITGYTGYGKAGAEAEENFILSKPKDEVYQRFKNLIDGSEIEGSSIRLTIDIELNEYASGLFKNQKGAVVAIDPKTGEILAMVSSPSYDPNTIYENWNDIKDDSESPLINRATSGLYPPGSIFKLVTATAAIEYMADYESYSYNCTGSVNINDRLIKCYNGKAHGNVDFKKAFAYSCNCAFVDIAGKIGPSALINVANRLLFNTNYDFDLSHSVSSFKLTEGNSSKYLADTAIGQGETLVTPLHMAILVSAVANEGVAVSSYIIKSKIGYGMFKSENVHGKSNETVLFSTKTAGLLKEMMLDVVNYGTGTAAGASGYDIAGKTGTAQNAKEKDHSWFIGFAPYDDPKIAVAVVIENAEGGASAASIAKKVIDKYINK
ncbi:MAG: penicillin-binding transpeptidase domain-containing protein [Lachnospiraceae bacterium]|nr:penicillin-binding transpeptidase domain-containing protein [Lachnospiraceae bacterium]